MQSQYQNASSPPAPWGYWTTLGWALLAFAISLVVTALFLSWLNLNPVSLPTRANYDGTTIAITIFVSTPVQIAILVLAAQIRRWPATDYLGLVWPGRREVYVGLAGVVVLIVAFDGMFLLFGEEIVSEFQIGIYRDADAGGWLLWLLIAAAVVAPIGEEIMFRGFLFRGWARTRTDAPYAIAVIALAWSVLHIQYNWLGILQVFTAGLLLGWMRWLTGSTLLTIMMHSAINVVAMAETAVRFEWTRG
ncbi:MAG: CPBP family intramembrane metalloprotease, partial [Rhizobiales bacterium]|nr:CPBP family intramembrane metalloprotease [Hyphomicrobiales bacterium]